MISGRSSGICADTPGYINNGLINTTSEEAGLGEG
jgi:hypothetical protein